MKPGDRDELWMHKWAFGPLETIQSEAFYRMIGRTGITYGEDFRMVKRVSCRGGDAMMRSARLSGSCKPDPECTVIKHADLWQPHAWVGNSATTCCALSGLKGVICLPEMHWLASWSPLLACSSAMRASPLARPLARMCLQVGRVLDPSAGRHAAAERGRDTRLRAARSHAHPLHRHQQRRRHPGRPDHGGPPILSAFLIPVSAPWPSLQLNAICEIPTAP